MTARRVFSYVNVRGRYYPMIPVVIRARYVTKLYALVDSGATISLFHISIASDAGIDLRDAEKEYLAGVGGYVPAYIKKEIDLEIESLGRLKVPIAFTEYISSDLAILGRQGFFEYFEIVFREWRRELELRPRSNM